jgi:enoyl-CoA hydratase/carnithine racemase
MSKTTLRVSQSGGVRRIAFVTDEGINTLTFSNMIALEKELCAADEDEDVRTVLLHGEGRLFSAGLNLADMLEIVSSSEYDGAPLEKLVATLVRFGKPLIAAVHGAVVGGGATILLHCDLVLAAEGTTFRLPFVPLGVVPEFASAFLLPRSAGRLLANELIFLAEPFDTDTAMRAGIVNRVLNERDLMCEASKWAERIASFPPEAVRASKRLLKSNTDAVVAMARAETRDLKAGFASAAFCEAAAQFAKA